jgi:hypothetical protein
MSMELKFRGKGQKVLGAGDWWVEHERAGTTLCTGLWEGGKVVALLVAEGEDALDNEYLKTKGDAIVRACNSHDQLVAALRKAEEALESCYNITDWPADGTTSQDQALSAVRAALTAAGAA